MKEKLLKRKGIRRVISFVLCLAMCLSLLPVSGMKVQAAEYTMTPMPSNISNKIIKPVPGLTVEQAIEICKDSSYSAVIYKIEEGMVYSVVKWDSEWYNNRPQSLSYLSSEDLSGFAVIGTVENHEHVWTYETEDENTFVGYCKTPECSAYSQDNPIFLTLRVPDVVLAGTNAPAYYNPSAQLTWENITGNSAPDIKYYADASLSTPVEDITAEKGGTYYAAAKIAGTEVVAKTKFTIAYVVDNLVTGEPASGEKLSTPNINEWSGYETPDAFWKNAFITNANSDLSAKCHWIYRPYGELNGKKIDDVTFNTYGKSELTIDESWSGGSIYVEMDFGKGIVLCSKPMNIKTEPFKISWKEDSFVGKWNTYPGATKYWVVLYKNNSAIIDSYKTTRPGSVGNVKEYDFESMIEAQGTGKYKFSVSPYVSDKYIDTGMKSSEIIYCSSHTYGEYMVDDEGKHYQKCSFCDRESEHEAHYGGTADCIHKAVCEVCSMEYGEVDLTKHDYSESVPNGDGTYKIVCKVCGKDYEPAITVDGLLVGTGFVGNTLTTNISYDDDIVDEYFDEKLKPNDSSADPVQYGKFYYIPKDSDEEVLIDSSKIISDPYGEELKLVIEEEWADGQIYVQYENIYGKKYVSQRIPIYKVRGQISVDDLEYTIDVIDDTFFATLTGPSDISGDIVIPEKITNNGIDIPVTAIADNLFTNNQNITSVTMSDTVKSIGTSAFFMCKNLKSLVLSNNIDASKFYADPGGIGMIKSCEKLESINIPATVEIIPYDFFWGVPDIKEITLPSSIKSIAENTFKTFYSLETVRFLGTEEEWITLINENCGEGNGVLKTANVVCHIHSGGTATCTEMAVCDDCGEEYGDLLEHSYEFDIHTPTCTENGYQVITCKNCDYTSTVFAGSAYGHQEETVPGKAATCNETGLTDGTKCSICGVPMVNQEVIAATGNHNFSKYVSNGDGTHKVVCKDCNAPQSGHDADACSGGTATCTAKAKCSKCGEEYGTLAAHKGGTATCKVKAKCSVCGDEYGSLAAHTYATEWSTDTTNHWHACSVCEAKNDNGAHVDNDNNEKCDACGYNIHSHSGTKVAQVDATCSSYGVKEYYKCSCEKYYTDSACTNEIADLAAWKSGNGRIEMKDHSGGTATCKAKAVCTVCGKEYGSLAAHTYATEWNTDATNHWHACTICEAKKDDGAHADFNKDGKCDTCSYNIHSHSGTKVAQVDATCSTYGVKEYYKCSCGKYYTDSACTNEIADLAAWKSGNGRIEMKDHSGGTATCTKKAVCEDCGEEYGSLAAHTYATEWSTDTTNHWHACSVCEAKNDNGAHVDNDNNEKCDACGYNMHSHSGTKVAQVDATCSSYGVKEYYKCSCGKYYTDSACANEIADLAAWKSGNGRIEMKDHSGGTATCKAKAKCTVCGKEYGSLAAHTLKTTIKATLPANGKKETKCSVCGKVTKTETIKVAKTSISKLTAGKKSFTVKWAKKTTQVMGYEIQYSTSRSFKSGNKTVKITLAKTTSKTIKRLKAKKKYYVRIRTYKTVNKVKCYSEWSAKKSVTTKK